MPTRSLVFAAAAALLMTAISVTGQGDKTMAITFDDQNRDFIDAVAAAGHTIGNHSFSHRDFGTMSVEDYAIDIQKGGDAIKPWLKGTHFFRYPLLRQGDTAEKRDAILSWLALRGIRVAPVTIDNDDFVYNQRLVDAIAKGETIDVRAEYLDHMNALYLDELLQRLRQNGWSFIPFEDALTDSVYH